MIQEVCIEFFAHFVVCQIDFKSTAVIWIVESLLVHNTVKPPYVNNSVKRTPLIT